MTTNDLSGKFQQTYHERYAHVRSLLTLHEEGIWQYLLAINGGGSVAVLAFIGAWPEIRSNALSYWVLGVCVFGLLGVGFGRSLQYYVLANVMQGWNDDMMAVYAKTISPKQMMENDFKRTYKFSTWVRILGWTSFVSFLFAVLLSGVLIAGVIK